MRRRNFTSFNTPRVVSGAVMNRRLLVLFQLQIMDLHGLRERYVE